MGGRAVPVLAALMVMRSAAAQEPAVMPASLGAALAPTSVIEGLDVRPGPTLEFSRAWLWKVAAVRRRREELRAAGRLEGRTPAALAGEGAALTGTLRVPVIAVRYADVASPYPAVKLATRLFGPSRGDTVSYTGYWREVSGGLLGVEGIVTTWVRLPHAARHYLAASEYGWGRFGRIAEFRREALERTDPSIDFGQFDNDGPDGRPNSGDDDGYVDFVAFFYATDCGPGPRDGAIWPHRGAMAPYVTDDRAAGGGRIRITDYVVLPAQSPDGCAPAQVGVLAHETAHAFGLPDLYDYDGSSRGIGSWGLMGTGSHTSPHSPAHPAAWAKEQLGWVEVDPLETGHVGVLPPVQTAARVFRYPVPDGSGRYLLLENRTAAGSDRDLPGHGLLVWGIDPEREQPGAWNLDERRPAVTLLARDTLGDGLVAGGGHDRSGPFPGHAGLSPGGDRLPVRLDVLTDGGMLRVRVRPAPRLAWSRPALRLAAVAGGAVVSREARVAGTAPGEPWRARTSAPWLRLSRDGGALRLAADPGALAPGTHSGVVELVAGRYGHVADRLTVRLDVAAPGGALVLERQVAWGWGLAEAGDRLVRPGTAWDPFGLRPLPRLLRLDAEGGFSRTLARLPTEALYSPVAAPDGGVWVLARARDRTYVYHVDPAGNASVRASDVVEGPAYGLAALPDGSLLVAAWSGRVVRVDPAGRVQPWADLAQPVYQIAADGRGTVYAALLSGRVLRISPTGRITALPTGFGRGRTVAVAVAPDGRAFAAERGGAGRVVELRPDGPRVVATVGGGAFYGLAADAGSLYALDLGHRQLLRLPLPAPTATLLATEDDEGDRAGTGAPQAPTP